LSTPSTIAIDGFAASGKSTVAALLAQSLGYLYFDTGVMYRAVTWAVLHHHIDPADTEAASALAESLTIDVQPGGPDDGRQYTVRVEGRDVTWDIRRPEVDDCVSVVAAYPRVRAALTRQQRRIAEAGNIVMAGRDIGTVVLPHADLKIFLQASAEERARRRYQQAVARNGSADYQEILASIIHRDKLDKENPVSPTKPAPGAVLVNTDNLGIDEVVAQLEQLVANAKNGAR